MKTKEIYQIIESILFANPSTINQSQLNQVFNSPVPSLRDSVERLNNFYSKYEKPYSINSIAGGFQLATNSDFDIWIRRLLRKSNKLTLSSAAFLAILTAVFSDFLACSIASN